MLGRRTLHARGRRRALGAAVLGVAVLLPALSLVAPTAAAAPATAASTASPGDRLHLVTLDGPGLAGRGDGTLPDWWRDVDMAAERARLLALVEAPEPVYTWTTALHGFAVRLSDQQAERLASLPGVSHVEPDSVRPLATAGVAPASAAAVAAPPAAPSSGGAGTVIGVVDTGLDPDSRAFAATPGLGRGPDQFRGTCAEGEDWSRADCSTKVVAAQWFVDGFGEDRIRSAAVLSPRDTDGHGTQMASIAAGNAGVPVRDGNQELGRFSGQAPRARLAVYKACWSAPDPVDDGCATADLVTAIDRATQDGVDVLSLSVGGPARVDTVDRALLGAAEADVVVVAAAGNDGARSTAAHPVPWVTTVGAASAPARRGQVTTDDGLTLPGAMVSTRGVRSARVALAADVRAPGVSRERARVCAPGSLDAGRTADRVVVCERGGDVGRVEKSRTVQLADGVGMVLVNERRGGVAEDFHSIPSVHVALEAGRDLVRWARANPRGRVSLEPGGVVDREPAVSGWSSPGSPELAVAKPDVVAPGSGMLAAVPASQGAEWAFVTGTSAAAAYTAGVAATVAARADLSAAQVRSAVTTTARPVPGGGVLGSGAGLVRPARVTSPGLVHDVPRGAYRAWLDDRDAGLNSASVRLDRAERVQERTVTNLGRRSLYFSSRTVGFRGDVRVSPAALRLAPGETATYRVEQVGPITDVDDGFVVWRGAAGTITRVPVLVAP